MSHQNQSQEEQNSDQATQIQSKLINLLATVETQERPLLIEFAGSPKSGKTTYIAAISTFFRRHKVRTNIITECASISPISDKTSVAFNMWTGATNLANLLQGAESDYQILLFDRGIFDTLIWMHYHYKQKRIGETEWKCICDFFANKRWTSLVNLVVVLSSSPESSIKRHSLYQIAPLQGSIMNQKVLADYYESLMYGIKKFTNQFQILHIETSNLNPIDGIAQITSLLVDKLEEIYSG